MRGLCDGATVTPATANPGHLMLEPAASGVHLHRIGEQAKRAGVPFIPLIETGDPASYAPAARAAAGHNI